MYVLLSFFTDNDLLSKSKIDYPILFHLEMKSETPKRPLPRTPHCEELQKFPWFQDISRKDAELVVSRGKTFQNTKHVSICIH